MSAHGSTAALRAHLQAIGALNPDGVGRTIAAGRCPDCRAEVLRGLDGPVAARPAVVDVIEVDELGEALAVATGRARWWIGKFGNGKRQLSWQFVPRWIDSLGRPRRGPVFVEHRCGAPPPPTAQSQFVAPRRTARYSDEPDF